MKLLIIEDDIKLSNILEKGLKKIGFAVDVALDGEEGLYYIDLNIYDLIILDINLPKINGFEVLKEIRKNHNKTKVLILSAKNQIEDKIYGFDNGANDYLEKPFDFLELNARIRNLLRWNFYMEDNIIKFKDLKINISNKSVYKLENEINLTNKEFAILEYLAINKERYVSTEEIIEHTWDSQANLFSNSFKFHISSLKKKLDTDSVILNSRGKGYKFGG